MITIVPMMPYPNISFLLGCFAGAAIRQAALRQTHLIPQAGTHMAVVTVAYANGSESENVEPLPASLCIDTLPLSSSQMRRVIARPRPVPPEF
jgi:hypothetical protein